MEYEPIMSPNFVKTTAKKIFKTLHTQSTCKRVTYISIPVLCAVFSIGSAQALEPFQANYSFNIAGLLTGKATRTLTKQDDIWSYNFKASVASLADANEVSHFKVVHVDNNSTEVQILDHAYHFSFLNKKIDHGFSVDWKNQMVTARNKNGDSSYPTQSGMLDMLDLELQVRDDIKHKRLKSSYLLADDKGIKKISFVNEGDEKIKTDAGEYDTVKVRLVQDNEKRKTYFWLAPKLDYLPVRVHQDDGSLSYELSLTSYHAGTK
jgi:hypothetical protein